MSDRDLRELERRFRQTGDLADEEAWFQQLVRTGALEQRLTALVEQADEHGDEADVLASEWIEFEVLHLGDGREGEPAEQAADAVEAAGYERPGLRPMDREEAQRFLTWRFRSTQAYSVLVQPQEAAEAMAAEVLQLLPSWTVLLTNVGRGWSDSSMSWSRGLTEHTFDDGVLAWSRSVVVVIWFTDED